MSSTCYSNIAEKHMGKVISAMETIRNDESGSDEVHIAFKDGSYLIHTHLDSGCETVWLEDTDICFNDLIGSVLYSIKRCPNYAQDRWDMCTTYKLQTSTHCATLLWCGTRKCEGRKMTDNEKRILQWGNMLRDDADDIIKFLAEGDMDMVCFSANMALECSKRITNLSEIMENKDEI